MNDIPLQYDIASPQGSLFGAYLTDHVKDLVHSRTENWNGRYDEHDLEDIGGLVTSECESEKRKFFISRENGVIFFNIGAWCYASVYADSIAKADSLMEEARKIWPPRKPVTSMMVPISFWSYGSNGPGNVSREILGLKWDEIKENYASLIRDEISEVVTQFIPSTSGQLVLWTGAPGTGKTTALRSLAYEWKSWCDMHYITDVEKFFGTHADYMIQVLLENSGSERWKLLILEDAGEFLQPSAKMETAGGSPALSRFLNTVDGLIGHGLKTLVLVTTNEPVKTLHKAVSRPGRCAYDIDFKGMKPEEAIEWLRNRGMGEEDLPGETHLADLYAKLNGVKSGTKDRSTPVGFGS